MADPLNARAITFTNVVRGARFPCTICSRRTSLAEAWTIFYFVEGDPDQHNCWVCESCARAAAAERQVMVEDRPRLGIISVGGFGT